MSHVSTSVVAAPHCLKVPAHVLAVIVHSTYSEAFICNVPSTEQARKEEEKRKEELRAKLTISQAPEVSE